jgi:hypothetical protein
MADDDPGDPGPLADELYDVDPADFVARRTELVRRLRAEKRRDEAARVAKLRRPSPAAWALNRLARRHRAELEALVRLGDDLRAAQSRALGGGGGTELRQAARDRRDAVAALTGVAARLLAERGGGVDAHLPGVTATLDAASLDPDAGATVLAGRLSTELEAPSGFGGPAVDLPDLGSPADATSPHVAEPEAEPVAEPDPAADKEREDAERAVAAAARQAEDLTAAARAAAVAAAQRRRAVEEAEVAVATHRDQLDEAERRLADARREAADGERLALEADRAAAAAADRLADAGLRVRRAGG